MSMTNAHLADLLNCSAELNEGFTKEVYLEAARRIRACKCQGGTRAYCGCKLCQLPVVDTPPHASSEERFVGFNKPRGTHEAEA